VKAEFWVMRVLLHPGAHRPVTLGDMEAKAAVATLALVATGDLCCLPDGCIAEPVEVFTSELDARAHRVALRSDCPGEDFRIVLNTDCPV